MAQIGEGNHLISTLLFICRYIDEEIERGSTGGSAVRAAVIKCDDEIQQCKQELGDLTTELQEIIEIENKLQTQAREQEIADVPYWELEHDKQIQLLYKIQ